MSGWSPCFEPVGGADADLLLRLAQAFRREQGETFDAGCAAAVVRIAQGEAPARAWLVRDGAEAVGYLVITLGYSIEYGGRDGFIDELYLVPPARRRGWGRHLVGFACAQARLLGIRTLHLEVGRGNVLAARLYRANGFEATGRELMRLRLAR